MNYEKRHFPLYPGKTMSQAISKIIARWVIYLLSIMTVKYVIIIVTALVFLE